MDLGNLENVSYMRYAHKQFRRGLLGRSERMISSNDKCWSCPSPSSAGEPALARKESQHGQTEAARTILKSRKASQTQRTSQVHRFPHSGHSKRKSEQEVKPA